MTESALSLFEPDDTPLRVADLTVAHATTSDVAEFCRRYHYSQHSGSASWRYGLWSGAVLLGVVAYNLPSRTVCGSVFGPEGIPHVWHMGRLVCAPQAPPNSASRLIGRSLRLVAVERPEVWAVLTYAAQSRGHLGYVYQATNALYTGLGGIGQSYSLIDRKGRERSRNQGGVNITTDTALAMGWTVSSSLPKHRYVYLLGDRRRRRLLRQTLQFPVLPYPKNTTN